MLFAIIQTLGYSRWLLFVMTKRGKSELQKTGFHLTNGWGNSRESATENNRQVYLKCILNNALL